MKVMKVGLPAKAMAVFMMLFLGVMSFSSTATAASEGSGERPVVGNVDQMQGEVQLIRKGESMVVSANTLFQEGDRLHTKTGGLVRIRFRDNTRITLAETTKFELERYQYNPDKEGGSVVRLKLLSGAFRAVTGAVGQQRSPSFEVETPVATMGIRGTDFWGGFIFSGDLDVAMISGKGVYVRNMQGRVEIALPGEGTTVIAGDAPGATKRWPKAKLLRAIASTELAP